MQALLLHMEGRTSHFYPVYLNFYTNINSPLRKGEKKGYTMVREFTTGFYILLIHIFLEQQNSLLHLSVS